MYLPLGLTVLYVLVSITSSDALTCHGCRSDSATGCKVTRMAQICSLPLPGTQVFCMYKEEYSVDRKVRLVTAGCEQVGAQSRLVKEQVPQCASTYNTVVESCVVCVQDYCNNPAVAISSKGWAACFSLIALYVVNLLRTSF